MSVVRPPDGEPTAQTLEFPFAVFGRGEDSDIRLESSKVSFRHAYLQVISGRVCCIDLGSRNGTRWSGGTAHWGWVSANEALGLGPYEVRLTGNGPATSAATAPDDFKPLDRYRDQLGPLPQVDLEFLHDNAPQPTWSVNRAITLVGRGPQCKLRFAAKNISTVHCSLVLTPTGLWVVDLLGRDGTKVNGENIRCAPLVHNDELSIGRYRIAVRYIDASQPHEPSSDAGPIEYEDDIDSPFLDAAPPPEEKKPLEWLGKIFRIEGEGNTLIVIPVIDGCGFRYSQLQTEANSLRRKFELKEFKNLLMDLSHLHYFGSELIGVLIALARKTTEGGGKAAMCSGSDKMLEVLKNMSLLKLWPYFSSREDALRSIES
ncbi:MAG: FHA domain-containing protein [Planctomycetaceae bacterium]